MNYYKVNGMETHGEPLGAAVAGDRISGGVFTLLCVPRAPLARHATVRLFLS
jgi:hypothetical protein